MFCYNCGAKNDDSARFCEKCGTQLDVDGEFYWDNHKYDELTVRVTTGGGHKSLKSEIAVLPFFEKKWY